MRKNEQDAEDRQRNDLRRRLSFLQFNAEDEENLKALSKVLTPHIGDLVQRFYRHLQQFEETGSVLSDELIATRLVALQRRYLERLTEGGYDSQYAAERLRIGQAHHRIGLAPRWYIGAYSLYIHLLVPLIFEAFSDDPTRIQKTLLSLTKILMLDMQLAIEAYINSYSEQLQEANRQLEAYNRDLERMVDQRTRERERLEIQLIQSERFAAIGQLAAHVAHEIRNPLSSIELNLDLLADEIASGPGMNVQEAQELLKSIRAVVERLDAIISEYLAFARLPQFEFEMESLNAVIQTFCKFVEPQLRRANVDLKTDLDPDLPLTLLDAEQIQRALHNFLKNAVEAMPDGGELLMTTRRNRDEIVLRIADTGHGIPEKDLQRIFDPFFTTKKEGTGLGLPLVQEIIKQHKGTISCSSVLGKGAEFVVTLPIQQREGTGD
jgi:signal transduction histidine kinase